MGPWVVLGPELWGLDFGVRALGSGGFVSGFGRFGVWTWVRVLGSQGLRSGPWALEFGLWSLGFPDPLSGLGSWAGVFEPGLFELFGGGEGSRPNFWLRVCLSWLWVLLGGPKGPDPVSGLGRPRLKKLVIRKGLTWAPTVLSNPKP